MKDTNNALEGSFNNQKGVSMINYNYWIPNDKEWHHLVYVNGQIYVDGQYRGKVK